MIPALLIVVIAVHVLLHLRARKILHHWATRNGLEILQYESRWLFPRVFFWTASRAQHVFWVQVRDRSGACRTAFVCCGNHFLGVLVDQARVRWIPVPAAQPGFEVIMKGEPGWHAPDGRSPES